MLIALLWYPNEKLYKFRILVLAVTMWLILRIGFIGVFFMGRVPQFRGSPLVPEVNQVPGLEFYIPGSVFGGLAGLLACVGVSLVALVIVAPLVREQRLEVKYLAVVACLCPIVALIFVAFEITFSFVTIDFAITALTLGWILSATKRSKAAQTDDSGEDRVRKSSGYDRTVQMRSKKWMARILTVVANLPRHALSLLPAIARAGGFVFVAVIPAILLTWAFRNIFGDGSAVLWAAIWVTGLGLGLTTFAVARFYERRERAAEVAVAAFLCAFAIMIFDLDDLGKTFIDVFTTPVLVLGTLALIVTVVLDKYRWSWPLWACYLFVYILVHSLSGSYVRGVSKLDLFSWIHMSVIVFVFLFAIPVYFASDQAQGRTRLATPNELSG